MLIKYEVRDGVAVVTLNRPERLNALLKEMREALGTHFQEAAKDERVRCVLLRGEGTAFCAGGDVVQIDAGTVASNSEIVKLSHRMIRSLVAIEKPVIAAVRGPTAGMGWSLAMASDLVIASETAIFSQVFRHIGLVPDGGAVWFLTQYIGTQRAKELVFSGRRIDGREAYALGLVTRVVPDEDLDQLAWQTALDYAQGPTHALGASKRLFRFMHQPDLEALLAEEAATQIRALDTHDHKEGIRAFLEKRKPQFNGR